MTGDAIVDLMVLLSYGHLCQLLCGAVVRLGQVGVQVRVGGQEPHVTLARRHALVVGFAHYLPAELVGELTNYDHGLLLLQILQILTDNQSNKRNGKNKKMNFKIILQ